MHPGKRDSAARPTGRGLHLTGRIVSDVAVAGDYPGARTGIFESVCFWGGPPALKTLAVIPVADAIVRRCWIADPVRGHLFAEQDHLGPPEPWPAHDTADGRRFAIDHPEDDIVPVAGRVLVLGGSWDRNYYHWLLNWLPRLAVARLLAPQLLDGPSVRIMVDRGSAGAPFQDFLRFLGIAAERILWVDADTVYRVDEAIAVTFDRDYSRVVLRRLADDILRGAAPTDTAPIRRIWIDRQGNEAGKRRVANHAAIAPILAAHGFAAIRLETLPLARQIALFASAEAIAGVNGAGLANMIFAPAGCRVVVVEKLYTRRIRADGMFSTLAAVCGLESEILYGRSARDATLGTSASFWQRHNQGVLIDPAALDGALARAIRPGISPDAA
jgi:hypothetical protein